MDPDPISAQNIPIFLKNTVSEKEQFIEVQNFLTCIWPKGLYRIVKYLTERKQACFTHESSFHTFERIIFSKSHF